MILILLPLKANMTPWILIVYLKRHSGACVGNMHHAWGKQRDGEYLTDITSFNNGQLKKSYLGISPTLHSLFKTMVYMNTAARRVERQDGCPVSTCVSMGVSFAFVGDRWRGSRAFLASSMQTTRHGSSSTEIHVQRWTAKSVHTAF